MMHRTLLTGLISIAVVVGHDQRAIAAEPSDSVQTSATAAEPPITDEVRAWRFFHMAPLSRTKDWGWGSVIGENVVLGVNADVHSPNRRASTQAADPLIKIEYENQRLVGVAAKHAYFRAVLERVFGVPNSDARLDSIYDPKNPLGPFPPTLPESDETGTSASADSLEADLREVAARVEDEYRWALFFRIASESMKGRRLKWDRVQEQMTSLDRLVLDARLRAAVALDCDITDNHKESLLSGLRSSLDHYITKERRKLMRDVLEQVFEVTDEVSSFKPMLDEMWGPNDRLEDPGDNLRKALDKGGSRADASRTGTRPTPRR